MEMIIFTINQYKKTCTQWVLLSDRLCIKDSGEETQLCDLQREDGPRHNAFFLSGWMFCVEEYVWILVVLWWGWHWCGHLYPFVHSSSYAITSCRRRRSSSTRRRIECNNGITHLNAPRGGLGLSSRPVAPKVAVPHSEWVRFCNTYIYSAELRANDDYGCRRRGPRRQ